MRNRVQNNAGVIPFPSPTRTFARRPIASSAPRMTCLVLILHGQSEKACKVSDSGVAAEAVWIPKVMVSLDEFSERGILVASMSKAFAERKNLHPRFIDPSLFDQATADVLREANARAARKRNLYRGHQQPLPYPGRNAFA